MSILDQQLLHGFCHLRPDRSFAYGDYCSDLCIRCSGIYSAFLIGFVLAVLFRWNGRLLAGAASWTQIVPAFLMLGISPLQVFIEDNGYPPEYFYANGPRFIAGAMAGFALLQMMLLFEEPNEKKKSLFWFPFLSFFLFAGNYYLFKASSLWTNLASLVGLVLMYVLMNRMVLKSFWPKLNGWTLWALVVTLVAAEWVALYAYNTKA